MQREHNTAIVLSAGRGSRMHSDIRKQYMKLGEYPVLYYSLKQFEEFEGIDEIILVTGTEDIEYCRKEIVEAFQMHKVSKIIPGGPERYLSVYHGLCAVEHCDYIFIHDGVRPLIDREILERALTEVRKWKACVAAMPVKDTIKIVDEEGFAVSTPDRRTLWLVQTPQVFAFDLIKEAYDALMINPGNDVTDDAMVMERFGKIPVKLVEGSYKNIKLTTPEDIRIAEAVQAK